MIAFIDDHREAYGVEPICKVLPIAPSTYRANVVQRIDPSKRSARVQRDAYLKTEVDASLRGELRGLWGAQGLAAVAAGRLRGRTLYRRTG